MAKIKSILFFFFFLFSTSFSAQVVDEVVQLDTIFETIKVIYKPINSSSYFTKKFGVFADDTSKIAIEKTFNVNGQNGIYKVYYPSGRLKVFTVFANNKINGEWTWYDEKGIILVKGTYQNGVKHGYWAYKNVRIYGRYKKGLKHKRWIRKDINEKKYISHYQKGVLVAGEGHDSDKMHLGVVKDTTKISKDTVQQEISQPNVLYEQAISFLTNNIVCKKAIKAHFGGTFKKTLAIKKYYKNDKFQFAISPSVLSLDNTIFYQQSSTGKMEIAIIDSILKTLPNSFDKQPINLIKTDQSLFLQSTKKTSPMVVYFGELNANLMRIDVVKYNESVEENSFLEKYITANENQKFSILLYFDKNGVLKGAEYQKP
ncbi:MAG: hypothetical protein CO118_04900 [Flavobacteriales bacterium CG_4_9_14_3_um_filter_32_8]|nr:MAG: hypothetical protein CO118_04900 [Flavobacteriales bacterium CG_4_9_14_3_um_filter_32_8]